MDIIFKEDYLDDEAENSKEGVREVFTAGRTYTVRSSFGKKMVKKNFAKEAEKDLT
jgi:hypothetical protein